MTLGACEHTPLLFDTEVEIMSYAIWTIVALACVWLLGMAWQRHKRKQGEVLYKAFTDGYWWGRAGHAIAQASPYPTNTKEHAYWIVGVARGKLVRRKLHWDK